MAEERAERRLAVLARARELAAQGEAHAKQLQFFERQRSSVVRTVTIHDGVEGMKRMCSDGQRKLDEIHAKLDPADVVPLPHDDRVQFLLRKEAALKAEIAGLREGLAPEDVVVD